MDLFDQFLHDYHERLNQASVFLHWSPTLIVKLRKPRKRGDASWVLAVDACFLVGQPTQRPKA